MSSIMSGRSVSLRAGAEPIRRGETNVLDHGQAGSPHAQSRHCRAVLAEPQLAFDMLAAASMRLRQLVDEIEQLKARSAPQRIADFFVQQATESSGPARIALPYEKALIASRLGMKPESFSRALLRS